MPQVGATGAGLTITPTFDPSLDANEIAVINSAIAFYQNTFKDPINVTIKFQDMGAGLGQSSTSVYHLSYQTVITALRGSATSVDDALAIGGGRLPISSTNPINGSGLIYVKTANIRALGIAGSYPPGSGFDGIIGINTALTDADGGVFSMLAVVEHEIDEVLGLGSALGTGLTDPEPEDLFRYTTTANVRSFSTNSCTAPPVAIFSIDGTAEVNRFNNCDNGGDYGDWVTHTPSQVQDAITNGSGSPSLNLTSTEVRALDVIGYDTVTPPAITVSDVTVTEGNSGTTNATLVVTLSAPSTAASFVSYQTVDNTATTLANPATITIPDNSAQGLAVPYPAIINVPAGLGSTTKVRVKLFGYNHTYSQDTDVLLVGPLGQKVVLMSDVGGSNIVSGINLTFDDSASTFINGTLVSGTFKPTNINDNDPPVDDWPGVSGPYGSTLSVFNGSDPAGQWQLFVVDDFQSQDGGSFAGGWSLELTPGPAQDYVPTVGTLTFPAGTTTQNIVIPVNGDATIEPTETFFVNLSNAVNATISDGQGVVTILNDDGPAPAITSITPNSGSQTSPVNVTIAGTNFSDVSRVDFSGLGVSASIPTSVTSTSLQTQVTITPGAATGARTVTVTAGALTSAPFSSFTVNPPGGTKRRGQITSN